MNKIDIRSQSKRLVQKFIQLEIVVVVAAAVVIDVCVGFMITLSHEDYVLHHYKLSFSFFKVFTHLPQLHLSSWGSKIVVLPHYKMASE